jgi:hypothetical protein
MRSLSRSRNLLLVAMLMAVISCQQGSSPSNVAPVSTVSALPADISLSTSLVELGQVRIGEVRKFHAFVRNHTNKPLHFKGFKTSCSCSNLTVAEKELPAGGEVRIEGQFRGQGQYGQFNRSIDIHWSDVEPAVLHLTGEVYRDLVFEPEALVLSPDAGLQLADEGRVTIRNRSAKSVQFCWGRLPAGITVSQPRCELPAGGSVILQIKADPELLVKDQFQLVASSNHDSEPRITFPVSIQPRNPLHVHPPGFHWGLLSQKEWQAKSPLRVRLSGAVLDRCVVSKVECPAYLKQLNHEQAGQSRERVFLFAPDSEVLPVNLNGSIVFHLLVKGQQQPVMLSVPVTGLLRDSQMVRR